MTETGSQAIFHAAELDAVNPIARQQFHDLAGMVAFIGAQRVRIGVLATEMSECQKAFTTSLVSLQQKADDAQTEALAALEKGLDAAADWLKADYAARLPAIQSAKAARKVELEQQITELTDQRTQVEKQSADELEALRKSNPGFNQREEELKAEVARHQQALAEVDAQIVQAGGGLGWLLKFGKIRELRELHHRWELALYASQAKLIEVRTNWQKQHEQVDTSEDRLQKAWRLRTADLARRTEELQRLQDDLEGVCRREALTALLTDLKEPQPTGLADADAAIQKYISLRTQVADATVGIGDSAELIGLMNGIGSGLEKLQTSVEAVKSEQDMHSELASLKLNTPPVVMDFHGIWDVLLPVVQDENAAALHPRDFHAKLKAEIGSHLTDKQIEAMFVALGDELNRATKEQWG
jgi:hypothetical protein